MVVQPDAAFKHRWAAGKLEWDLERFTEHRQLGLQEVDALLVEDTSRVRSLGLPPRVLLEQRSTERRSDVRHERSQHADEQHALDEEGADGVPVQPVSFRVPASVMVEVASGLVSKR